MLPVYFQANPNQFDVILRSNGLSRRVLSVKAQQLRYSKKSDTNLKLKNEKNIVSIYKLNVNKPQLKFTLYFFK